MMTRRQIRLRLLWHPQAQFAGYLLAASEGLDRRRGFELICQPIDFKQGGMSALLDGACEVAVASPGHLLESSAPSRLAYLMAVQQASPLVYPVRKGSGIESCVALEGKPVAVWPGGEDLELRWMVKRAGGDPLKLMRVPTLDTVEQFLAGKVVSAQMTTYHELHQLEQRGLPTSELHLFRADSVGAGMLKDGLVARRDWIADEAGLVADIVECFLEGWQLAFSEPDRAIAACRSARPGMSEAEHVLQLRHMMDLAASGHALEHGFGVPHIDHVRRPAEALLDVEGVRPTADPAEIVIDQFWKAAPSNLKTLKWADNLTSS